MHGNKKWTPARIDALESCYQNKGLKACAKRFSISEAYCMELIKRFNIKKSKTRLVWEEGDDYLVVGLRTENVSFAEIAEKMEKSVEQTRRFISYLKRTGRYYDLFTRYVIENNSRLKV